MSPPEPYYSDDLVTLHLGDCLAVLATMEDSSVDAVVCDPPYGLEFMGREWDAPWRGGINADAGFSPVGLSDGGDRLPRPTFTGSTNPHCRNCRGRRRGRRDGTAIWKTCTCENPDFPNVRATEMRAFQEWCEAWAVECLRVLKPGGHLLAFGGTRTWHRLACGIEDAGFEIRDSIDWIYGSGFPKNPACLKPAHEPIVMARKPSGNSAPLPGLDACRVGTVDHLGRPSGSTALGLMNDDVWEPRRQVSNGHDAGRWPPNVVLGAEAAAELGRQSGASVSRIGKPRQSAEPGDGYGMTHTGAEYDDAGGASRFFPVFRYEPKAPKSERPKLPDGTAWPTVKPLDLMRWLVRLVTPPGGLVLDPFAGSGTTGEACVIEGFPCILIDKDPVAAELIKARLSKPIQPVMFGDVA